MQTTTNNRQSIALVGASLLAVVWVAHYFSSSTMPDVGQVNPLEAFALIQTGRTLVLDVREKDAYDKGHLPGAISVPIGELDKRIEEFAAHKAEEVVVYCNDGSNRGPKATAIMNKAGYPGAKNLNGGVEGWRKANYEMVGK